MQVATGARVKQRQLALRTNGRLNLEEEILSLHELLPEAIGQLPVIFSEVVVDSAYKVLGEAAGEAFVMDLGDERLRDPAGVYSSLEDLLGGRADGMRQAIGERFRRKVHLLYKTALGLAE